MNACKIADLDCQLLMPEPVAAAYEFSLVDKNPNVKKKCLVFDFGGGKHEVTILDIFKGEISVLCV